MAKPGAKTWHERVKMEERRRRVCELLFRGLTQRQIVEELNRGAAPADQVSLTTVNTDVRAIRKEWLDRAVADVAAVKGEQAAQLARAQQEAWEAWEKSKRSAERTRTKKTERPGGGSGTGPAQVLEASVEREESHGDPAYLAKVIECSREIRKIYGADAPERKEILGDPDRPVGLKVIKGIDPDQVP